MAMRSLAEAQQLASALPSRPGSVTTKSAPQPSPPSRPGGILGELGPDPRARLKPPDPSRPAPAQPPGPSPPVLKPVDPKLAGQLASQGPAAGLVSARSLGAPSPPRPGAVPGLTDARSGLKPVPKPGPKPPPPPPPPPPGSSSRGAVGVPGAAAPQVWGCASDALTLMHSRPCCCQPSSVSSPHRWHGP